MELEKLLGELKSQLIFDGLNDIVQNIEDAVSSGSTGTEIYVLLRGTLLEPYFGYKNVISENTEQQRKMLLFYIDRQLAK